MTKFRLMFAAMLVAICGTVLSQSNSDPDDSSFIPPTKSSADYSASMAASIDRLNARQFDETLRYPSLGSASADDLKIVLAKIEAGSVLGEVALGDPGINYDLILQPGHYRRINGATGASGKLISERTLVSYIVGVSAKALRARGLKVLVISADNYANGLIAKIFLSIHADGSTNQCKTGPSLAYKQGSSPLAMHAIGWGLTQAMGYSYGDMQKDNFTANAARYYMFNKVDASLMTGLLEVGEITCSSTEPRLIMSADTIGANIGIATSFLLEAADVPLPQKE